MNSDLKLLRYEDLVKMTGLSRTTIWRHCKSGTFPQPMRIGNGVPLWRERDLIVWLDAIDPEDDRLFVSHQAERAG
jgi:prophage regulatory protein